MKIDKTNFFITTKATFTGLKKIPKRNPDFISYEKRIFVTFDLLNELDFVNKDDNDNVISAGFCNSDDTLEEYELLKTIIGKFGDEGYIFQRETKKISSKYWYTDTGVIRESNHWNKIASCHWDINNSEIGFCKWNNFNYWENTY